MTSEQVNKIIDLLKELAAIKDNILYATYFEYLEWYETYLNL